MSTERNESIRRFEHKQLIVAGLGLVIFIGLSIIANSLHLSSVAEQTTKYISRMIQLEDFREVGLTLQETRLGNFRRIEYKSDRPGRSFALPNVVLHKNSVWDYLSTETITLQADNPLQPNIRDTITFEYNRFLLVPYAFLAWIILVLVSIPQTRMVKQKLVKQFEKDIAIELAQAKADIAKQVRHNLRTPLAALMRIPSRLPDSVRSDRELLTSSICQIRSLVSALDENRTQKNSEPITNEIYDSLVNSANEAFLATPKHIKFEYDIEDSIVSACVPHVQYELRAIIGNVVNNALDAIGGPEGHIWLTARDTGVGVSITIRDTGRGIPKDIIDHIFEKGFSSHKPSGSGIGLYHAKTWVEKWGGRISAESKPDEMTTISIFLPIIDRTPWYVPRLKFSRDDTIFILDDQATAHDLWKLRLEEVGLLNQAYFASTPQGITDTLKKVNAAIEKSHFLFDYDLSAKQTGFDVLDSLPNNGRKFLVTGHFDEPEIRRRCDAKGIYLLPKGTVPTIPIVVT